MKATGAMMILAMLAVASAVASSLLSLFLKNQKKILLLATGCAAIAASKKSVVVKQTVKIFDNLGYIFMPFQFQFLVGLKGPIASIKIEMRPETKD